MMKFNINETVRFELTETGAAIWNARFADTPHIPVPAPKKKGDTVEAQLWNVMEVFGPHMYFGMGESPFAEGVLKIEVGSTTTRDLADAELRDEFAKAALTGALSRGWRFPPDVAKEVYAVADAMMGARK